MKITVAMFNELKTENERVNGELAKANALITELTKEKNSAATMRDYESKNATASRAEVESLHTMLDALPGTLPRKYLPDSTQEWNVQQHNALTRLSVFLATRS